MIDLRNRTVSNIQRMTALEKQLLSLEKKEKIISHLEHEINEMEQYSSRSCIHIFRVEEEKNGNTDEVVIPVAKKMKVDVRLDQIDKSHRVGKIPQDKVKSHGIIFKLSSYRTSQMLIKHRSILKGTKIAVL